MNFFDRQRTLRRTSARLVLLFVLAVVGIVAMIDLGVFLAFGLQNESSESILPVLVVVSVLVVVAIGLASWIRSLMLRRGGGGEVARSLGGVPVPEDTTDPALRRLRNVVEEIAIASGMPVPDLYVLSHEPGINAFAAGWSPADAAVAVTQGTLDRLNRDELQGVIAHEFSHVVNGDMRLNIRLIGVLFGIIGLTLVGRLVLYSGRGGGRNAAPIVLVGLVAMVAGYVGVVAGRLIKAAVSRQREYLADASAVQFTRQPSGIAGALKKIGGLTDGSTLTSSKTEEVSHMLFGEGMRFSSMFATHPPLVKRIQLLDPTFQPQELERLRESWSRQPPSGQAEDAALGLAPPTVDAPAPRRGAPTLPVDPDVVLARVGESPAGAYQHAARLVDAIPEQLRARARRPETALPLIFGLLLSQQPDAFARQHQALVSRHGAPLAAAASLEATAAGALDPMLRLPLAELAFPALRHRHGDELEAILTTIGELIRADGRVSVFEYCLPTLLHRDLHEALYRSPPWQRHRTTLARSRREIETLLAVLASVGAQDAAAAETAYRSGLERVLPDARPEFDPPAQGPMALEQVWAKLDGLTGRDKASLVEAIVAAIRNDGVVTVEESELLRTVCAVLHCPLPPLTIPAGPEHGRPSGHLGGSTATP